MFLPVYNTYIYVHSQGDRESMGVSSYGVSQTTMEEVFLKVGSGSADIL